MGRHGENIRKRSDGRWEGRYKVFDENKGRSIYRSVYSRSYEAVKEKLSKAKFELTCEKEVKDAKEALKAADSHITLLFAQAAEEWLGEVAERRKYSTYVKYRTVYQTHLAKAAGQCQISGTGFFQLSTKIFDHLSEENLSESLKKSIGCVANQILSFANRNYSAGVPLLERPSVKLKKGNVKTLTKAEQARLLSHIYQETDRSKIAVLLCLCTGLRLGELCALQWEDLDIKSMTITVNRTVQRIAVAEGSTKTVLLETEPKSESSKRSIPITAEMLCLLMQLKESQPYIFGREKPLDPRTMQYRFQKFLREAKIDSRNFHILRHTFATNCVENNMDVKALSEILGHADVKLTLNRYVHPTMDSKRKQIEMLLDFYGQICGQAA